MTKVLLVEDDNNLREIYEARLQAEGYTIVSASDGEEALVVAKAEKPDLIVSDVMMPKISGFEMLDILRNTEGLRDTKVIMLTALGQTDDRTRADSLGADRYLVKSQVTLEDIVKAAHELIEGETATTTPDLAALDASSAAAPVTESPTTEPAAPAVAEAPVELAAPVAAAPEIPVTPAPPVTPESPAPAPEVAPEPTSTPVADDSTTGQPATDTSAGAPVTDFSAPTEVTTPTASVSDSTSDTTAVPTPDLTTPTTDTSIPPVPDLSSVEASAVADDSQAAAVVAEPTPEVATPDLGTVAEPELPAPAEPTPATTPEPEATAPVETPATSEPTGFSMPDLTTPTEATTPATELSPEGVEASADAKMESSTSAEEQQNVEAQIEEFINNAEATAPAPAAETTPADDTDTSNAQTLNDAVDTLVASTDQSAPQLSSDVTAVEVPPSEAPAPELPKPEAPAPNHEDSDAVAVNHKKVIRPITTDENKPSLDELLAREEARNIVSGAAPAVVGSQPATDASQAAPSAPAAPTEEAGTPPPAPGSSIAPQNNSDKDDFDPHSIAL